MRSKTYTWQCVSKRYIFLGVATAFFLGLGLGLKSRVTINVNSDTDKPHSVPLQDSLKVESNMSIGSILTEPFKNVFSNTVRKYTPPPSPEHVANFIDRFKDLAVSEDDKFGIPASFKLAQAALESAWGRSIGSTKYNAFFGIHKMSNDIKGSECWDGKVWNGDNGSKLCAYETAWKSWRHHSEFLTHRKYYAKLFDCTKLQRSERAKCWCEKIEQTPYCENRKGYGKKIWNIISKYDLIRLDQRKYEYVDNF